MRLCTYRDGRGRLRPGRVLGSQIEPLQADSLVDFLASRAADPPTEAPLALADVELAAPIPEPPAIRDFYAFEEHVVTARRNRGVQVPPEWYDQPVFYFTNPAAVYGPGDTIPFPRAAPGGDRPVAKLDYELEVAAVIGAAGRIAGFTIMNDWSARDLQAQEVPVGLGPAKGKDFATSLGPVLVTVDEFDGRQGAMVARVNGEERSRGNLADIYFDWDAIVARAALNTTLRVGDVIGSGTVGSGCILEHGDDRWLAEGDVVELEIEGIGVLRNTVGAQAAP